jgi:DNA-directed RNA polymerase subunit beta
VSSRSVALDRYSFGNIEETLELPDLIAVQRESFVWLLAEGLSETFRDISPIKGLL